MTSLQAMTKLGFIDGTIVQPEPGSSDFEPWIVCDAMFRSWI